MIEGKAFAAIRRGRRSRQSTGTLGRLGGAAIPTPVIYTQNGNRPHLKLILAFARGRLFAVKTAFAAVFRRCLAACLLATLASGCSTINVAYTAGPTVLSFIADGYLDLDGDQESALKQRILALREWDRSTNLAGYAALLGEVRARAAGRISPEDVAWTVAEARKRSIPMAERVAGEVADLAPLLTAENLAAMKKKMESKTADYVKEVVRASPEKQRARRLETIVKETERWFGDLEDQQLDRIRVMVDALPANYALALENRQRRAAEFLAILSAAVDKSADKIQTRRRLLRLLTDWESIRTPAYQAFAPQYQAASYKLTAEIVNMTTQAQRETAQKRAQRWVTDMSALAARPAP